MSKESFKVKVGLAEMLKGGVIMDVTNLEQAKIGLEERLFLMLHSSHPRIQKLVG